MSDVPTIVSIVHFNYVYHQCCSWQCGGTLTLIAHVQYVLQAPLVITHAPMPGSTRGKSASFFYENSRKRWVYRSLPSKLSFIQRWWLTLPYVWFFFSVGWLKASDRKGLYRSERVQNWSNSCTRKIFFFRCEPAVSPTRCSLIFHVLPFLIFPCALNIHLNC